MLKPKQIPLALIGIFTSLALTDGDPTPGQLKAGLVIALLTVAYVISMLLVNEYLDNNQFKK